jgi:hypothetical protein
MPEAAIWRANSLPMPDDAPVINAQGPNFVLSIVVIALSLGCLV